MRMTKLIIRLSELVGIVCLIAFIIFVSSEEKISTVEPEQLSEKVISAVNTDELTKRNSLFFKKKYKISTDGFEFFTYYSSDSVMDVRELLIIKLDDSLSNDTIEAIEAELGQKQTLFDYYAPEQSALLRTRVLVYEKGYLLFAVGEDADKALSAFRNNL